MRNFVPIMENQEIEHKFLVKDQSYRELATQQYVIKQGYLSVHPTVRVRRKGDKAFLTIKNRPEAGHLARFEWEKEITLADFDALFPLCCPEPIDKVRFIVPLQDGLVCEIDEFHGRNEGLILAEIELPTEDTPLPHPDFLGEDVTADHRYYNSYLSGHSYQDW